MKILILGDDGRAHALAWKFFDSPNVEVFCASGNGGTSLLAAQVDLDPNDAAAVARWAFANGVDIIVPANSEPLRAGLVDEVVAVQIGVCGPSQRSTQLEWSTSATRAFLQRAQLPTPRGRAFRDLATAEKYLASQPLPLLVRADRPGDDSGLYHERLAALEALRLLFATPSGDGSEPVVVVEEYLSGAHISFSALTDGSTAIPLLPTRIYHHLERADSSPYAPGMGAHTGNSNYAHKLATYLHERLMLPIVAQLQAERLPYWGFLGIDCIVTEQGPRITTLRCSLSDQEAQVVLPRLEDDLTPLVQAAIARRLDRIPPLRWRDEASVGISLVTQGYPHHYAIGGTVEGLSDIEPGVLVFHHQTHNASGLRYNATPGTQFNPLSGLIIGRPGLPGGITTTGGHVLTVVARAGTLQGARGRALLNAEKIRFNGCYYREDIGEREFA
jgi:phosphoribosylamine--glycine ligase